MSHQPERKEKNCLNCGTTVLGHFCHVCGQENIETKQSFFGLLQHFVYDIFHFDSQFFDTLKFVLFRPGYISRQYVEGKRARYLNPIRMYLFTSAIFFLFLFSFRDPAKAGLININMSSEALKEERLETIGELKKELVKKPSDTALLHFLNRLQDTTHAMTISEIENARSSSFVELDDDHFKSIAAYDSFQQTLSPDKRDGWMKRRFIKKGLAVNSKYKGKASEGVQEFLELFMHKLPYLLFVSLPFFALILKLLYVRRKVFFYSDHAVFTLHLYIFSFILLLVLSLFGLVADLSHLKLFQNLIPYVALLWPVYLIVAMRNFYTQGWGKTFSKFLLLNVLGFIVLLLLFVVFLFFTLFQL